jgi:hypothetical protein
MIEDLRKIAPHIIEMGDEMQSLGQGKGRGREREERERGEGEGRRGGEGRRDGREEVGGGRRERREEKGERRGDGSAIFKYKIGTQEYMNDASSTLKEMNNQLNQLRDGLDSYKRIPDLLQDGFPAFKESLFSSYFAHVFVILFAIVHVFFILFFILFYIYF